MTGPVRSFIAVTLPPESTERLRMAQERLKACDAGIRWVKPDGFHITLKFLGDVDPGTLTALWRSVAAALEGSTAFVMQFEGVGAFPNPTRPRVVWAGVTEGAAELKALSERVETACADHGFEREKRPFSAHMTLGRVRGSAPNPGLGALMAQLATEKLGEVDVARVVLMKSDLTRQGAVYQELEQKTLLRREEAR